MDRMRIDAAIVSSVALRLRGLVDKRVAREAAACASHTKQNFEQTKVLTLFLHA
jgi:hypothetical protein